MTLSDRCPGCMSAHTTAYPCPICGWNPESHEASSHHIRPGTLLHDRYYVGRVLGQGGFGITYLGWDTTLDVKIAIKEYFPLSLVTRNPDTMAISCASRQSAGDFDYGLEKFLDEARILASFVNNPNIVSARDFFKEYGSAYMVMEYIDGKDLKSYVEQHGGRISWQQAQDVMMHVMDALADVHNEGLLHRDISPDNIFITARGQIKVLDFGAARSALGVQNKSLSVVLKPGYAPPEQYQTRGNQGPWTDVYSIAATLYRCVTGAIPAESLERLEDETLPPISAYGVEVPAVFESAVLKGLSVKVKDRFQSVQDFQSALRGEAVGSVAPQAPHQNFNAADTTTIRQPQRIADPSVSVPKRPQSVQEPQTVKIGKKRMAAIAASIFIVLAIGALSLAFMDAKPDTLYAKGQDYLSGTGGQTKPEKAAELFEKAANQGHVDSMLNLGGLYESGTGVLKNVQKAAEWYLNAANSGSLEAKARLGNLYYKGEGVDKDTKKAAELLKAPADDGNVNAQYLLGLLYLEGNGVPKDTKLATQYLQKPADSGNAKAAGKLADLYLSGASGQKDPVRGMQLLEQAASKGDVDSQYRLAEAYQTGSNTTKNLEKAKQLYELAQTNGHPEAGQKLASLNKTEGVKQGQTPTVTPTASNLKAKPVATIKEGNAKTEKPRNAKPAATAVKPKVQPQKKAKVQPSEQDDRDDVDFSDYDENERKKRMEGYKMIQDDFNNRKK